MNNQSMYVSGQFVAKNDSKGFSLIELLVAMAVFAILSVGIVTLFDSFQRGYTEQQVTSDIIQKARSALVFMTSEMKIAGLDPRETGEFGVVTADAATFTYDFDTPDSTDTFDGIRNVSLTMPERKTYRFISGRLEQVDNLGLVASPVIETLIPEIDTANSKFEYMKSDQTILPVPITGSALRDIAYVRVVLTVIESAGRSGNISRNMDALILCRNLQYNAQR